LKSPADWSATEKKRPCEASMIIPCPCSANVWYAGVVDTAVASTIAVPKAARGDDVTELAVRNREHHEARGA